MERLQLCLYDCQEDHPVYGFMKQSFCSFFSLVLGIMSCFSCLGVNLNEMGDCFPVKYMFVSFMCGSGTQMVLIWGRKGREMKFHMTLYSISAPHDAYLQRWIIAILESGIINHMLP